MLFWILTGVLTAFTAYLLLRPLMREHLGGSAAARAHALRDILAALDRDRKAGLIENVESDDAGARLARALIAETKDAPPAQSPPPARGFAIAIVVLLALSAPLLYFASGSSEPMASSGETETEIRKLIEETAALRRAVEKDVKDPEAQKRLGENYFKLGAFAEAAEAFKAAIQRGGTGAALHDEYGIALTLAGDRVTPEAVSAFTKALTLAPGDVMARFYLARARAEAGDVSRALTEWEALLPDVPPDAPIRAALAERIATARQMAGQPALNSGAVDAAATLSPAERTQMIEGMVERLAARLEEEPKDLAGWRQLIRSYGALGAHSKAMTALARAREIFAGDAPALSALDQSEKALPQGQE